MPRGSGGRLRFSGRVEKAFGLQLRLQPQELLEQGALACTLHALDDQLQVTTLLVDAQPATQLDQFAVRAAKNP